MEEPITAFALRFSSPHCLPVDLSLTTIRAKLHRMVRGISMNLGDTAKTGVSPRQMARKLSQEDLYELLTAVAKTPPVVLLSVAHVLGLLAAFVTAADHLPAGGGIGGSGNRGGRAAIPETSRRVIRAAAGAPAGARRSSLTTDIKEAVAFIATAKKDIQEMREQGPAFKGRSGAVKRKGWGEEAKQARRLQSWAAKAKRNAPLLLERLESGGTEIGVEDARFLKFLIKDIPIEKAARVSTETVDVYGQGVK